MNREHVREGIVFTDGSSSSNTSHTRLCVEDLVSKLISMEPPQLAILNFKMILPVLML